MTGFLTPAPALAAAVLCLVAVSSMHPHTALGDAPQATAAPAGHAATPAENAAPAGDVDVAVPTALIWATDTLSPVLERSHHYELTVKVWVAGGQPTTQATVVLTGADHALCATRAVPAGAVTTLRCSFTPQLVAQSGLTVHVLVEATGETPVVAAFDHAVVATAPSE